MYIWLHMVFCYWVLQKFLNEYYFYMNHLLDKSFNQLLNDL